MNKTEYNREVRKWRKWADEFKRFNERQAQLLKSIKGNTKEELDKIENILYQEFKTTASEIFFGPWTKIYDVRDLSDPEFILPGQNYPFLSLDYSEKIIKAFGKIVESKDLKVKGRVIGYAYDAGDDYLILDSGKEKEEYLILNSKWEIKEDD